MKPEYAAERWLDVVGYEPFYQVSNMGRVRSKDRAQSTYGGRHFVRRGTLMKLTLIKDRGYLVVTLRGDGRGQRKYVHDLVLTAFVGPRPAPGLHCCHGDGNPANNCLANLRWDTPQANVWDKFLHGTAQLGEKHWKSIYTLDQIKEVKRLLAEGVRVCDVSKATGVSQVTVSMVKSGRQWRHAA